MKKRVLLSFDVEEFDIPMEYGAKISEEEQLAIGYEGVEIMKQLLARNGVSATLYTTAFYAKNFPQQIQELAKTHEIASHAFYHSQFKEEDLLASKQTLESISQQTIHGFRMPRMAPLSSQSILMAGYRYNASLNPTWLPGRYNHFAEPRTLFYTETLVEVPASVTPFFRIPIFWLAFKNLPLSILKGLCNRILNNDGYIHLYFHPWELCPKINQDRFCLPGYVSRGCARRLRDKLERWIAYYQRSSEFMTTNTFLNWYEKK